MFKARYTLVTKSKGRLTFRRQSWPYRRQSRPSWRQCRPCRRIVAGFVNSQLCHQRVVVLGLKWQSNNVLAPVYWCSMARRWASEKFQCFASFFHSFGRSCFVASFHRMSLSCSAACGFARFSGNVLTEEYSVVVVPFYTRQKQHISK